MELPANGTLDPRPPQLDEVQAAVTRVYQQALTLETGREPYALAGDFNGDESPDLAVIVRPALGKLMEINHELANWMLGDPRKTIVPDTSVRVHHLPPPSAMEQVTIEECDLLLAIIHGYGLSGWRNPGARQSYLLKNAAGDGMRRLPLAEALNSFKGFPRAPQLKGDVIRLKLSGESGLLYYTGAKYAWRQLSPSNAHRSQMMRSRS